MNKKEEKTIALITKALETLLEEKQYSEISISDIILESTVSRSTFYSHFKKKDDVLRNVCTSIFNNVFSSSPKLESKEEMPLTFYDYRWMTTHIFFRFKEERKLIRAIFASGASHLFYSTLGKEVRNLMSVVLPQIKLKHPHVPDGYIKTAMSGAFVDLLKDYVVNEHSETAEEMTMYFYSLFE